VVNNGCVEGSDVGPLCGFIFHFISVLETELDSEWDPIGHQSADAGSFTPFPREIIADEWRSVVLLTLEFISIDTLPIKVQVEEALPSPELLLLLFLQLAPVKEPWGTNSGIKHLEPPFFPASSEVPGTPGFSLGSKVSLQSAKTCGLPNPSLSALRDLKMWKKIAATALVLALVPLAEVSAGPLAYGICQTGCNAVAVACYAAGGAVFGTVTAGVGTPLAIIGCNVALGTCMAGCVAAGLSPTP
jgi:hypothetical protein